MLKRLFDLFSSILAIIVLSPLFLLFALFIPLESKGGVFYKQERIGKSGRKFMLYKFRTMSEVGS